MIGGIAKGSGMINPNMATMLSFITTDAAVSPEDAGQGVLKADVKTSYNQICVDGDTSTNDTVAVLANGLAGNDRDHRSEARSSRCFQRSACGGDQVYLAKKLARDGEGATKLIECQRAAGAGS